MKIINDHLLPKGITEADFSECIRSFLEYTKKQLVKFDFNVNYFEPKKEVKVVLSDERLFSVYGTETEDDLKKKLIDLCNKIEGQQSEEICSMILKRPILIMVLLRLFQVIFPTI